MFASVSVCVQKLNRRQLAILDSAGRTIIQETRDMGSTLFRLGGWCSFGRTKRSCTAASADTEWFDCGGKLHFPFFFSFLASILTVQKGTKLHSCKPFWSARKTQLGMQCLEGAAIRA